VQYQLGSSVLPAQQKPFVFVLMPFDSAFDDVYKFGIKSAADELGAYAERVDEQLFTGSVLDRIINQINKADVIIADMTGRNPNVFYEVGFAHAVGKLAVLLTQDPNDIPFDLKHHRHVVYSGSIDKLRALLLPMLNWALGESQRRLVHSNRTPISLRIGGGLVRSIDEGGAAQELRIERLRDVLFVLDIRNVSSEAIDPIDYIYVFARKERRLEPGRVVYSQRGYWDLYDIDPIIIGEDEKIAPFDLQYRLSASLPAIPPGAVARLELGFKILIANVASGADDFLLRLHLRHEAIDYPIRVAWGPEDKME
jgi:hypothetical protein